MLPVKRDKGFKTSWAISTITDAETVIFMRSLKWMTFILKSFLKRKMSSIKNSVFAKNDANIAPKMLNSARGTKKYVRTILNMLQTVINRNGAVIFPEALKTVHTNWERVDIIRIGAMADNIRLDAVFLKSI